MRLVIQRIFCTAILTLFAHTSNADVGKKIAVTDLSYEERVATYFHSYEMKGRYDSSSSSSSKSNGSINGFDDRNSDRSRDRGEIQVKSASGYQLFIDRGELRKFTADIKGGLLKSGNAVVQGRPWTQKNTEALYDIIGRIKSGSYPGADYVLWGTISSVDFRQDDAPVTGSSAVSHTLSLGLTVEFSLISTKNYKVVAAFSAMGEGSDTKLTNSLGDRVSLNRAKVVFDTSRSLGDAVAKELSGMSDFGNTPSAVQAREPAQDEGRVVIYH